MMSVVFALLSIRKQLVIGLTVLSLSFSGAAQTPGGTNVTIPVRTELNLMFTDVVINGETFKFLIDTGAPVVLSPETAKKVGFQPKYNSVIGSGNSKRGTGQVGTLPHKIELGSLKLDPPKEVYVTDYNANTQLIRCLDFDGIIGANIMKDAIWHFDYDNRKVQITKKLKNVAGIKSASKAKMKVGRKSKKPYVWVGVNDYYQGDMLFDTGYAGFVDWPTNIYQKALKYTDTAVGYEVLPAKGIGSEGIYGAEDTITYEMKASEVMVANETIKDPVIEISPMDLPKVGVKYMMGRLVTFDFRHKKWYVQKGKAPFQAQNYTHYQASFTLSDSTILIGSVFGELIDSDLIKSGDQVLAADGRNFFGSEPCKATFWLIERSRKGTGPLTLKIKRGETEKEVTLEKKRVFDR